MFPIPIFVLLILIALLWYYWETIKINWMVFLIVQRGILAPNCFWWSMSDMFLKDASGVHLFYDQSEKHGGVIPLNMFGTKIYLLADPALIKDVLDNSPSLFGVGKLKKQFFSSFMSGNLGVSHDEKWLKLRQENETVLKTGKTHPFVSQWNIWIHQGLNIFGIPLKFKTFQNLAIFLTIRIVFGETAPLNPKIFEIFQEANAVSFFWTGEAKISKNSRRVYNDYLDKAIENPDPTGLISMAVATGISKKDLLQQIPHWMFPIAGLISVSLPRILLMVTSHYDEIKYTPWRSRALETLRLNNPVVTTFRSLRRPLFMDFPAGTQFVILNNPILRDKKEFPNPNLYIPQRWNPQLERSYYAIMFNQGPQRCPGKDMSLSILELVGMAILQRAPILKAIYPAGFGPGKDVPQMINPCTITFSSGVE